MRKWLILLCSLIVLLFAAGVIGWLMRGVIVSSFIADACKARGFECIIERVDVRRSEITLNGLTVEDTRGAPVAQGNIKADLDWPGLFSPTVRSLKIDQNPRLNLRYDGRGFYLGSVPVSNLLSGDGGDGDLPAITIDNADIMLDTPAGRLTGNLSAKGAFPEQGKIAASLRPASLAEGPYRLDLKEGTLELDLSGGRMSGRLALNIESASLPGQSLINARADIRIPDDTVPELDWSLAAQVFSDNRIGTFTAFTAKGTLGLFEAPSEETVLDISLIQSFRAELKSGPSEFLNRQADTLAFQLQAERQTPREPLQIESEAAFANAVGPYGTAARGTVTLMGQTDPQAEFYSANGRIVFTDVAASNRASNSVTAFVPATIPIEAHGEDLRLALERALKGFSASADFGLAKSGRDPVVLTLNGPVALKAKSGASLLLTPADAAPVLISSPEGISISGLFSARDGGFPRFTADIREFKTSDENLSIKTGGINLKDWRAANVTLGADLTSLDVQHTPNGRSQISGNGQIRLDGPVLGIGISEGEIFGNMTAIHTQGAWRIQTENQSCIGLDYAGLRLARDLSLGSSTLRLCPPEGRLLISGPDGASGQLALGNLALPLTGNRFSGTLNLEQTNLDWKGGKQLDLNVSAQSARLPLKIDSRDLKLEGKSPRVRIRVGQTLNVDAGLGQATLSGGLVPANISMGNLALSGGFAGKGFQGTAQSQNVRISDFRDDPLYQPLLGSLEARFDGAQMALSGPFRIAKTGLYIADVSADINLLNLTGTADIDLQTLAFERKALQPSDLSERLRGFFTSATGSFDGTADFLIANGQVSGKGRFNISDLYLETVRLGPVFGINGDIVFDDLIGLSTSPGQTVTIDRMNPGVPLQNGVLKFQLIEGREARLESAIWPFAGGELSVKPTLWTIAGKTDTIEVRADRIELKDLIETLKVPNLQATGTVSGVFPIELRAGATYIKDARFAVDAQGGRLSYTGQTLSNAGASDEVVNDAFRALQNLQYTVLELKLNGNLLGDIALGALILGKNPDVLGGSEFEFDIALDSKLAQLLQTGREVATQDRLAEIVARRVDEQNAATDTPED